MKLLSSALLVSSLLAASAHAALISGPSNITATTSLIGAVGFSAVSQIVDGIDLNTDGPTFNGFRSNGVTSGSITLTLNTSYNLNQFLLANDINVQSEGIGAFNLDFYGTSGFISNASGFTAAQGLVAAQTFNFATVAGVNKVVLNITSAPAGRIEIREVAFNSTVPEVSSAMLGALGVLGFASRRRR